MAGVRRVQRLHVVLACMWTIGLVAVVVSAMRLPIFGWPAWWRLAITVILLVICETPLLSVRLGHQQEEYTFSGAPLIIGLVLLPGPWLILAEAACVLGVGIVRRRGLVKASFNAASVVTATSAAILVMFAFGYQWNGDFTMSSVPALIAAATVSAIVIEVTVALVISASQHVPVSQVLLPPLSLRVLNLVGNTFLGLMIVILARYNPITLAVLPPVLVALALLYRTSLRSSQERDAWQRLNAASDALAALPPADLEAAIVFHVEQLFRPDRALLQVDPPSERSAHVTGRTRLRSRVDIDLEGSGADVPVGTLTLLWDVPVRWSRRDHQVLEAFAHTAASRMSTARLRAQADEFAARMAHEATHDPLTGLPNRRLLLERAQQAVQDCTRDGESVGLLVLDLDGFKQVNDALGHAAGDQVLEQVGRRLSRAVRTGDLVARLGGDEFAVLAPGLASLDAAVSLAEQLLQVLARPVAYDALSLPVEASIGVACYPQDGRDVGELLRRADVAMYEAKAEHGSARRYRADRDTSSVDRLSLVGEMRPALANGQLRVFYQPELDLRTGEIVRVEALIRWAHPVRGLLPPADFLPALEHSGLVHEFTRHVLGQAARDCATWREYSPRLGVAINLSARTLLDDALPRTVRQTLAEANLPPAAITLELTETAVTTDYLAAGETLAALRDIGVRLAVDDFGTGYSSLTLLARVAVQDLKVDRSFVDAIMHPNGSAIVRATIDLGHRLGMRVVAEGVESAEQLEALRSMGCDLAQGYHVGRPMSADDMSRWLPEHSETAEPGGMVLPLRRAVR
jgi:diguanylate cyclase (GGDEF)-like protein